MILGGGGGEVGADQLNLAKENESKKAGEDKIFRNNQRMSLVSNPILDTD